MKSLLPGHRKSAGFIHSGFIELLLLICIVAAALNFALGNWRVAAAILVPLAALFFVIQYFVRRNICRIGDRVRVSMGPHAGKEGVVIGTNEAGTRLTVQTSSAGHPDSMDFNAYQLTQIKTGHTL